MHRQIAGKLTGPVTKWIVARRLARRPRRASARCPRSSIDVQNNEASSWLPGSAESTKVLDELSGTVDPNDIPTLVVYSRARRPHRGRLRGDGRAGRRDRRRSTASPTRAPCRPTLAEQAGVPVPLALRGRRGRLRLRSTFNFGQNGWNDIPAAADEIRDIAQIDGVDGPPRRLRRPGRRLRRGVRGHRHQPDPDHARRGHHDPAVHLPQPAAVAAADHLRGRGLHRLRRRRLPPREVRRPHGQRPEPGDPGHPGDRRRHRLRPAAGRPLSGRAAPPRGPARGDGVRAAPRRPGDPGQRRHRRGRHAVPARSPTSTPPPASARSTPSASPSPSW